MTNTIKTVIQSALVNGRIPANTVCPFREECPYSKSSCGHFGLAHKVDYSCGAARAFNLTYKG